MDEHNQVIIDGPRNKKLLITFDYPTEEIMTQAVNDDIFYAEEVEVQEDIINQEIVETSNVSIDFQNVQSEVTIKNECADIDGSSYQEVIQSLIPLSENNENQMKQQQFTTFKRKRWESESETTSDVNLDSSPTKSFFGTSMGVSRCHICQKFTKRSSYNSHMLEHFSNGSSINDEHLSEEVPVKTENYSMNISTATCHPYNSGSQDVIQEQETLNNVFNIQISEYKCSECELYLSSLEELHIHKDTEHNSVIKCGVCEFISTDSASLETHLKNHVGDNAMYVYECVTCSYVTNEEMEFNQHCITHTDKKPLKCNLCEFVALDASGLKNHMRQHYGDKPYVCPYCDYRSDDRSSLVEHVHIHTGEKPNQCPKCDFKCIQKAAMKAHIKIHAVKNSGGKHSTKTIHNCSDCDFSTPRKNSLIRHKLLHSEDKPYKCNECNYQSNQKSAYRSHLQRHRGEKPHKCTECSYSSVEKTHLIRHMRQHTGEKPIFCFSCDYRCIQFGCLVSHMKRHENSLIQCAFCSFNTTRSEAIIDHLRVDHKRCWHKVSILMCSICGFQCMSKHALDVHMSEQHSPNSGESPTLGGDSESLFKCAECDFQTTNKRYMKSHRKKEHP